MKRDEKYAGVSGGGLFTFFTYFKRLCIRIFIPHKLKKTPL